MDKVRSDLNSKTILVAGPLGAGVILNLYSYNPADTIVHQSSEMINEVDLVRGK